MALICPQQEFGLYRVSNGDVRPNALPALYWCYGAEAGSIEPNVTHCSQPPLELLSWKGVFARRTLERKGSCSMPICCVRVTSYLSGKVSIAECFVIKLRLVVYAALCNGAICCRCLAALSVALREPCCKNCQQSKSRSHAHGHQHHKRVSAHLHSCFPRCCCNTAAAAATAAATTAEPACD